jgi:hypothetical protein
VIDFAAHLPRLLPLAVDWVQAQEVEILASGRALTTGGQYETAGSIAALLAVYLEQIATVGYDNAPFELDAVRHERHAP